MSVKFFCMCLCAAILVACAPQEKTFLAVTEQNPVLLQSTPLTLQDIASSEKNISVYVAQNGQKNTAQTQALEAALQKEGYVITSSPSQAQYLVLATLVYEGSMTQAQAQRASVQEYGTVYTFGKAVLTEEDEEQSGHGLVLDIHVAVRENARKVRNNSLVVSTASLETVRDEASTRMVAFLSQERMEEQPEIHGKNTLMQHVAKALAKDL